MRNNTFISRFFKYITNIVYLNFRDIISFCIFKNIKLFILFIYDIFTNFYKKIIIGAVVLGIVGAAGYYINGALKEKEFKAANAAYAKLILNPKDEQAKAELKQKDASLYALYEFKRAVDNNDTNALKSLANEQIDPLLKDIVKSQINEPSGQILSSYKAVVRGYELMKENKIDEAKNEFKKVPLNSQLQSIVKNLEHYQGNAK